MGLEDFVSQSQSVGGSLTEESFIAALTALQRESNRQQYMLMSVRQSEAYKRFLVRMEVLRAELAATPRRRFVKRYVLRRMLGERRLHIFVPGALYRPVSRARLNWKYRNDPDW